MPPQLSLTVRQVEGLVAELAAYHARFAPLYKRKEQRHWGGQYLHGLLLELPEKTVAPMARALPKGNVRAMQQFVGEGAWEDGRLLAEHRRAVGETLGEPEGVLIVDGSEFPKQGKESVGVARQYCGAKGKVDNCQAGVFLAYASSRGYTLLDRRLYLPAVWFRAEYAARRRRYGVPPGRRFQTQGELAWEMIQRVQEAGELAVRWVLCDERFGRDRRLLDRLARAGLWYLAEVPVSERVWWQPAHTSRSKRSGRGRPRGRLRVAPGHTRPTPLKQLAQQLPPSAWRLHTIKEGSKGPLVAKFAWLRARAVRQGAPGPAVWVVLRRSLGVRPELKVYLCNAPARTPRRTLVGLSGMRWPIERCFEDSKGLLGMDQYEVRTWRGWHHHLTLVILAHHFLVGLQLRLKKGHPR